MEFNQPSSPYGGAPQYGAPQPPEQPKPPRTGRGKKDDSASPTVTKKVVDRQKRFALIFAVVVAVVVALVAYGATSPSTYVVRTTDNIAAGSPIDVHTQLEAVPVPQNLVEPGTFTGTSAAAALTLAQQTLANERAQYPVAADSQIHKDDFGITFALSSPLKPDERLMSIQASVANATAGQIKPGDHVDIAASDGTVAGVALQNVEVVAVTVSESQYQAVSNQQTGNDKNAKPEELLPGDPVPGIYTVRVSAADAAKLYAIDANASLALILRPQDGTATPTGPITVKSVICGGDTLSSGCQQN